MVIVDVNTLKDKNLLNINQNIYYMLERIEKIPVPLVLNIGFCCVTHKAWYIITLLNATKSRSSISVNVQHSGSVTLLK